MGKTSALVGKPAPVIELPRIPDGQAYKLPLGEKVCAVRRGIPAHGNAFPVDKTRSVEQ
jgi:hypothetical protein